MVLLIIIPIKWLAIIGNINPTFSGPNPYKSPCLMGKSTISMAIKWLAIIGNINPTFSDKNPYINHILTQHFNPTFSGPNPFRPRLVLAHILCGHWGDMLVVDGDDAARKGGGDPFLQVLRNGVASGGCCGAVTRKHGKNHGKTWENPDIPSG